MNETKQISDGAKKLILKATAYALKRHGGKAGGWASKQQLAAMLFINANETCATDEETEKMAAEMENGTILGEATNFFLNASATAQYMEKNGVIDKRTSRVAKRENIFAGFSA